MLNNKSGRRVLALVTILISPVGEPWFSSGKNQTDGFGLNAQERLPEGRRRNMRYKTLMLPFLWFLSHQKKQQFYWHGNAIWPRFGSWQYERGQAYPKILEQAVLKWKQSRQFCSNSLSTFEQTATNRPWMERFRPHLFWERWNVHTWPKWPLRAIELKKQRGVLQ